MLKVAAVPKLGKPECGHLGGDSIDKIRAPVHARVHAPPRAQTGACFDSIEIEFLLEFVPEFMPEMPILKGYLYGQVIILLLTDIDMENLGRKLWYGFFCPIVPESGSGALTVA